MTVGRRRERHQPHSTRRRRRRKTTIAALAACTTLWLPVHTHAAGDTINEPVDVTVAAADASDAARTYIDSIETDLHVGDLHSVIAAHRNWSEQRDLTAATVVAAAGVDDDELVAELQRQWSATPHERLSVVFEALAQVGTPYRYGSSDPERGLDCSGLIAYAWRHANVDVPPSSRTISGGNRVEPDVIEPGDVAWYPGHVMLHLGAGNLIVHAVGRGRPAEVRVAHRIERNIRIELPVTNPAENTAR